MVRKKRHSVIHPHVVVNYEVATHGDQVPVRIVLHDTESHDTKGIRDILGIAAYWRRESRYSARLGAHYIIDGDGNLGKGTHPGNITYGVLNHNTGCVHIELIGFAWYSVRRWRGRKAQLERLSKLIAYLSLRHSIPIKHSTRRGVCTHADFNVGHTDPGKNFPFPYVMERATYLKKNGWDHT